MALSFKKIFDHNFELLYGMACASLQEADAEEAVADTFIAFWKSQESIKYTFGDCRNWLIGVLKNKIRDKIRYYKSAKRTFIRTHGWIEEDESLNHVEDPNAEKIDYLRELKTALHLLSKKERQVLNLAMSGMTASEIANEVNTTVATVMNQRVTAIKKLRKHFGVTRGKSVRIGKKKKSL